MVNPTLVGALPNALWLHQVPESNKGSQSSCAKQSAIFNLIIIDHPHTWVIEGSTTATPPHRPKVNIYHDDHQHEDRDHWSSNGSSIYLGDWRINDAIAAPPHRPDNYLALRVVGVLGLHHTSNLCIIMIMVIIIIIIIIMIIMTMVTTMKVKKNAECFFFFN